MSRDDGGTGEGVINRTGGQKHSNVNIKRQTCEDRLHHRFQWRFEFMFVHDTCFIQEQFKSYVIMTQY